VTTGSNLSLFVRLNEKFEPWSLGGLQQVVLLYRPYSTQLGVYLQLRDYFPQRTIDHVDIVLEIEKQASRE